ncbi:3-hydroxyacyl-CoA dehydrogenase [Rhizobium alvei]|uniref:3-hydroxyacyl-CoA dehydrogenase n=1 Tax=Rhizobium alvei TaxID=1132659 RepID=A0ABT8YKV5_9HYPH|nr:3-hydroxyacyl-CoA dehydrogenase [Rhizobium alvei]MDO6964363.1 3-hydroxyacyl-CoA dehydrogenase [Rhizobium alvei]
MNIEGRTIYITGGASGLGAGVARHLAALGAKVGILDLNQDAGEALASALGGAFARCDVASEESAIAALDQLAATIGGPNALINCAGIGTAARIVGKDGPMPLSAFDKVIRVNLIGTFNMMRLAAARMQANEPNSDGERGVIISTASVAAYEGQIGQAAYAASKGGIVALTLPAAREFARIGIRVLTIAPGLFKTPLMDELPEEIQESLGRSIPFPSRLGLPEDFARLVQSMIENPYLNGETVRLDGALRMQPK